MKTSRFNLSLLYANQANKEMLVNENMNLLDHLIHPVIKSASIESMPLTPDYGDIYIIPAGASEWGGSEGSVALYIDEWIYFLPKIGMTAWIEDNNSFSLYNGRQWIVLYKAPS